MSLYLTIIGAVLFFLIIVATFVLWLTSDLLVAVLASAAISLVSSLIFLILQAPDVSNNRSFNWCGPYHRNLSLCIKESREERK